MPRSSSGSATWRWRPRRVEPPPADAAARLLADEVLAGRLTLNEWDHGVEQWILRLNLLASGVRNLQLPPITDEDRRHLIEQLCHGAFTLQGHQGPAGEAGWCTSWLTRAQRELAGQARARAARAVQRPHAQGDLRRGEPAAHRPAHPGAVRRDRRRRGSRMGRVPVLVHILAPSMRPVQITQDLAGFWREHYPRVKQELQRHYPKHEWR